MRRTAFFGALVLLTAAVAFQLLPAGGGQHYTTAVRNAISAIGGVGGGGSSSASASVSASETAAAAGVTYTATFSSTVAGLEVDITNLSPSFTNGWNARVELSTGEVCESNQPFSGFVDPTGSVGAIAFSDGGCTVSLVLLGTGTPTLVPQLDLQNPADPERILASAGLMNQRPATVIGGFISAESATGVLSGSGEMSSAVETGLSSTPPTASGGGTIDVSNGQQNRKANFGFNFSGSLAPRGSFLYHDHITEMVMHSTAVERFVVEGDTATVNGTGRVGAVAVQYRLRITEDPDTLDITITGPRINYSAAGPVSGNIDITA